MLSTMFILFERFLFWGKWLVSWWSLYICLQGKYIYIYMFARQVCIYMFVRMCACACACKIFFTHPVSFLSCRPSAWKRSKKQHQKFNQHCFLSSLYFICQVGNLHVCLCSSQKIITDRPHFSVSSALQHVNYLKVMVPIHDLSNCWRDGVCGEQCGTHVLHLPEWHVIPVQLPYCHISYGICGSVQI